MESLQEKWNGRVSECQSIDECLSLMVEFAQVLEFDCVAYGVRMPFNITQPKTVLVNNYPEIWQQTYAENNYLEKDPTVAHALRSVLPVVYSEKLFENSRDFYEDAVSAGIEHGWAQPVYDARSCGLVSFTRQGAPISELELSEKSSSLMWLSQAIHSTVGQLIIERDYPESLIQLTSREAEVLRWTAVGKTSGEIAIILGISERTVNFHINNSMEKLVCNNKTAAAIKATLLHLL